MNWRHPAPIAASVLQPQLATCNQNKNPILCLRLRAEKRDTVYECCTFSYRYNHINHDLDLARSD